MYLRFSASFSQPFLSQRAHFKQFFFIRHSSCFNLGNVSDCSCPVAIPNPIPGVHPTSPCLPAVGHDCSTSLPGVQHFYSPSCLLAIIKVISANSEQPHCSLHSLSSDTSLSGQCTVPPLGPVWPPLLSLERVLLRPGWGALPGSRVWNKYASGVLPKAECFGKLCCLF